MSTYLLFGKYTVTSLKKASDVRTGQARHVIEKSGGRMVAIHALLGPHDLLVQAEFPGNEDAMRASVGLTRLTGIGFTTCPAVPVERFDQLIRND